MLAHPPPRSLPKRERLLVVLGLGLLLWGRERGAMVSTCMQGVVLGLGLLHLVVRLIKHFGRRRERAAAAAAAAAAEWPRLRPGRCAWRSDRSVGGTRGGSGGTIARARRGAVSAARGWGGRRRGRCERERTRAVAARPVAATRRTARAQRAEVGGHGAGTRGGQQKCMQPTQPPSRRLELVLRVGGGVL